MNRQRVKIGEILLKYRHITKQMLDEALEYQQKSGSAITTYLVAHGYLKETDLAKCLTEQFNLPYLPLDIYTIPQHVIDSVPVEIAEKYWLMPVDQIKNVIMLAMADPLDRMAIAEVERVTHCKVQQLIGLISDIGKALQRYYGIDLPDTGLGAGCCCQVFIDTLKYRGFERRLSNRIKTDIELHYPINGSYVKAKTTNLSAIGLSFSSQTPLRVDSYLTAELDLPESIHPLPVAAVGKVTRCKLMKEKTFNIGLKFMRILKSDLNLVMQFAHSHS